MPLRSFFYIFSILLYTSFTLKAQSLHYLTNDPSLSITTYDVLADRRYSFEQVQADTSLVFRSNTPLSTSAADFYWIRVIIANPYPNTEKYQLSLSLPLNYTLYIFNTDSRKWESRTAGLAVHDRQRERGVIPCTLKGNTKNTLYLKIDVRDLKRYGYKINPVIVMEKELSFTGREQFLWYSWLICIVMLLCFSCYNLYILYQLKDNTYLWHLVVQVGAITFITSFKHFLNLLLPFSVYNLRLTPSGSVYHYDLNAFFLHIGCIIMLSGILQLTRSYLRTKELLPFYDRLLKYILLGYVAFELIPAIITLTGIYYLDSYTLFYDNIIILLVIAVTFITSAVAWKRRIRAARPFLLANTLPIVLGAGIAVYFIINSAPTYTRNGSLLPEIAILSQIITFAVALVTRIRTVNEELHVKELEIGKLEADIAQSSIKQLQIEQENAVIAQAIQQEKDRNEQLQQKLDANNRELVSNSVYIHQKNKLLDDLKRQLQDIDHLYPHVKHPGLKSIKSTLKDNQYLDAEWDKFRLHFEQVHPGFFENLKAKHPSLTNNELRLYAYFHINLSTKEIAALLNIEPASVRQAKARLNKKMNTATNAE